MAVLIVEYVEAILLNLYKSIFLGANALLVALLLPSKCLLSLVFPIAPKTFKSVLITGASSGIGAELARQYAGPGVYLTLTARRTEKLSQVKHQCEGYGAVVHTESVDVAEEQVMRKVVRAADDRCPLDLVIANAGISGPSVHKACEDLLCDGSSFITRVNIMGTLNTLLPIIPRMRLRKKGQLVIMSSLASYFGMTSDPLQMAYMTSKVWGRSYGMSLRSILQHENIGVTVICPGYIESEMSDEYKNAGIHWAKTAVSCELAVQQMLSGIKNNIGVVNINIGYFWLAAGALGYNLIPPFVGNYLCSLGWQ